MKLKFEWDTEKAIVNYKKHGVTFEEAVTVFTDPFSITIPDPDHSYAEQRFVDIGTSDKERLLVVIYTDRGTEIRIISCRKAGLRERNMYREGWRY